MARTQLLKLGSVDHRASVAVRPPDSSGARGFTLNRPTKATLVIALPLLAVAALIVKLAAGSPALPAVTSQAVEAPDPFNPVDPPLLSIAPALNGSAQPSSVPANRPRAQARSAPAKPQEYTVQPGDMLWTIAAKVYGGDRYAPKGVTAILKANPGVDPNRLRAGVTLVLPDKSLVVPAPKKPVASASSTAPSGNAPARSAGNRSAGTRSTSNAVASASTLGVRWAPVAVSAGLPARVGGSVGGSPEPARRTPARVLTPERIHVVKSAGESFYLLARRYYRNIGLHQKIRERNPGLSSPLRVGDRVVIPALVATPSTPTSRTAATPATRERTSAGGDTYRVKAGDTLSAISKRFYGTTRQVGAIVKANPGLDPRKMPVGTVLRLPRKR